jgi:beclin 1
VLLPHRVDRSTIGGLSVHYANSSEWTRAMKFLLTDLKWLLAWVTKRRHSTFVQKLNRPV